MYALHTLYDWDWDIPGVTFPMLVCAGVLIGSVRAGDRARSIAPHDYDTSAVRVLAIAAAALMLFTVALSAVLPSLAASRATAAQLDAATATSASDRTAADAEARVASSLDPLSGAGLRVRAEIALRAGQLRTARSLALDAIRRQPTDVASWQLLLGIESALHNDKAALAVSHRIIALQPADRGGRRLAVQLGILFAPPQKSATSVPTPLPTG
jgi:predicted Zn-dependent protease